MENETYTIFNNDGEYIRVPIDEYKKLRNKIRYRLLQFYQECTYKDADFLDADMLFFCVINGRMIIKRFNFAEWLEAERSGKFNDKYREFTKAKNTSVSISSLLGKGDRKFRKKRLH